MNKQEQETAGQYTRIPMTLLQLLTVIGVFGLLLTWIVRHFYAT